MKISSFFLSFLTVASSCSVVVGQLHSQSEPYICPTDWCMSVMSQMGRRLETTPEMAQASGGHGRRLLGISTLDFEGIGNLEPIGNSYAAAGIEFSSNALALIDNDVGGSGVFENEPSPSTILFFLSGDVVTITVPNGFQNGFSFFYSSAFGATVTIYSEENLQGTVLATLSLNAQHNEGCAGQFCNWSFAGVEFIGTAKSIDFGGTADQVGFDQLTFGSTVEGPILPPVRGPGGGDVGASGDPHFKAWSGSYYDFMGACDLLLVHAPNFEEEAALDIVIRTKVRNEYSFIEGAAVKIGNEVFEVASYGSSFLNGVADAEMPAAIFGFPITRTRKDKKSVTFKIHLGGNESITLGVYKDWVSVKIIEDGSYRYLGSEGMMGQFETGNLLARDGETILEDPLLMGQEWQVLASEPQLFQTVRAPQHPQQCEMPDLTKKTTRRLGEKIITYEEAADACAHWPGDALEACIHDVMASGDLDFADAGGF